MSSTKHVQKLSATKQRLSLGEVKKAEKQKAKGTTTNRKVIRTTVINSSEYEWPPISQDDEKALIDCLSRDLKSLSLPSCSPPLREVRQVKKEERREFRHKWFTQKYLELGFNFNAYSKLRKDILLGVNRVSTSLEQNLVDCIIIEKDVDPPLLTKLLVPLASSRGVPIVAVSGLNSTCKETFNTRCIALGLRKNCEEANHSFNHIFRLVLSIAEKQRAGADDTVSASPGAPQSQSSLSSSSETTAGGSEYFKPPKIRRV